MKEVSVREARENLARLLQEVEQGQEVCILRRGRPVARVVRAASAVPRFRSRAELRDNLPPMREGAADTIRALREDERY